jgi:osmotically-inducible protein OsmY
MAESEEPVLPDYLVAHVQEALAEDPRVSDLGIHVAVRGRKVFLSGTVASEERRLAVAAVVGEVASGYEIHNETEVAAYAEADDMETLT